MAIRNRHDLTSAERKQMPLHRGTLKYFPDALMVVAMLSKRADLKHSPNADPDDPERPKWIKGKSPDHGDCIARHQTDVGDFDPEVGLDYAVHVAWRGLAQLQHAIDHLGIDAVVDWNWQPPLPVPEVREHSPELLASIDAGIEEYRLENQYRLTNQRTESENPLPPADGFSLTTEDMRRVGSSRHGENPSLPVTGAEMKLSREPWNEKGRL
ncbi:hypothetical protein CMI47_04585 [Candidatus Pacearchaeota archaeon]|jgi:hypothetical protein|nr:hypothetical protein [Candidatus Pacearchaeota archaeon]|tara:strand:- start:8991 stop:9626 length:636 start_codon:yes stop_codon:yes gene_type:complete